MSEAKKFNSILYTIFLEAFRSPWLSILFFANIFLSGFLLQTEYLESGYSMHHWDFIIGVSGAFFLLVFRYLFKNPNSMIMAFTFLISGSGAALIPYVWATLILPQGVPIDMENRWVYALNGPVAQIVVIALIIGSFRYARKTSNSVAEKRSTLNFLRREMKVQIEQERAHIVELILDTVTPALNRVENRISGGAARGEISAGLNDVIAEVVRPLSHELDASASTLSYEINLRLIKRNFRKRRFRQYLQNLAPLHYAISTPLTFFGYMNFNLTTISYIHGFETAVKVSAPFLITSAALFFTCKKIAGNRVERVQQILILSTAISVFQALSFALLIEIFGPKELIQEVVAFSFMTFLFTFVPALLGVTVFNLRANLERESAITQEIAIKMSIIRRQLWSLRKKFAREIHGGLQSKLQIFALKFEQSESNQTQLAQEFKSEIKDSIRIEIADVDKQDFAGFIGELSEFWSDIAIISSNLSASTLQIIREDSLLQECLSEVIREAVNNAIKHSSASQISITLNAVTSATVELIVENNVLKDFEKTPRENFGTKIYRDLAHSWDLQFSSEKVKLTATFVLNV
jgi:signal transduction histidine kinase